MTRLGTPVALRWGSRDPAAPLIVLFHGRDATETDMTWLAPYLPDGAAYASVRAAGLLYGTLPFDAGVPVTRGRLAGVPVFVAHGLHDTIIPVGLQSRTWDYLVQESGSPLWAQREPTGHELTAKTASELAGWIEARLGYLQQRYVQQHDAVAEGAAAGQARWATLPDGLLPARQGPPPEVSVTTPQQQESQNAPVELQEALFSRVATLAGVATQPSVRRQPAPRAADPAGP